MMRKAISFVLSTALLWVISLTIGSYYLLCAAYALSVVIALALLSAAIGILTLQVKAECQKDTVNRGESAVIRLTSRHMCPIPPGAIEYAFESGGSVSLETVPFIVGRKTVRLLCRHRGVFCPGREKVTVTDVFGIFSFTKRVKNDAATLTVLPAGTNEYETYTSEKDTGEVRMHLQDDAQEPSGVRTWRDGDLIRRVHWKLTLKSFDAEGSVKPIVKTYDEAARPDALVLPDLSRVNAPEKRRLDTEDAVCECALSVLRAFDTVSDRALLMLGGLEVTLSDAARALAAVQFTENGGIEKLAGEVMRRGVRTGAAVFVTARLTYRDADALIRLTQAIMCETGLVWITDSRISEAERLKAKLEAGGVHVDIVSPKDGIVNERNIE